MNDLRRGAVLEARKNLERAVTLSPRSPAARAVLSQALLELGYEILAQQEAKMAFDLSPGLGRDDALLVKAQFYSTINDGANAARAYQTLFSFSPENEEYAICYALAISKEGRLKDALSVIENAKRRQITDNPKLDLAEANVAEQAGDYQHEYTAAERAEKRAKAVGLPYLVGHSELSEAWALDNLAKLPEAEQKARQAQTLLAGLNDVGGEGIAWKDLGDVYIDQQAPDKAKAAYGHASANFHRIGCRSGEAIALE